MSYIPNKDEDRKIMLEKLGLSSIDQLFTDVPEKYRFPKLNLAEPLSELEALSNLKKMAGRNDNSESYDWFLGGGIYNHFIPSLVPAITSRGEFLTAYTPYQPEVSQGTLEAIFEYQTMISELTGMEVVNASHYDGATALAEAVIMSVRATRKRKKVVLQPGIHPEYREVINSYIQGLDVEIVENEPIDGETAASVVFYPSFTGELADLREASRVAHENGALLIVHCDPMALGILESPGACGADIVTAEGQCLGVGMNFGGPCLGIFATTKKHIRKMPGRIIGETSDKGGNRGCVLTFAAREQHIRREKATSNICSNQGLAALSAAVYMAAMGKSGFKHVGELCWHRAHYGAKLIGELEGFTIKTKGDFFKEFLVETPINAETLFEKLEAKGIIAGLPLNRLEKGRDKELLISVTEMNSRESIERLVEALKGVINE